MDFLRHFASPPSGLQVATLGVDTGMIQFLNELRVRSGEACHEALQRGRARRITRGSPRD
jgi:hypothetical protein